MRKNTQKIYKLNSSIEDKLKKQFDIMNGGETRGVELLILSRHFIEFRVSKIEHGKFLCLSRHAYNDCFDEVFAAKENVEEVTIDEIFESLGIQEKPHERKVSFVDRVQIINDVEVTK